MFLRKEFSIPAISGDYQYIANYLGPISQRLWHQRKHDLLKKYLSPGSSYTKICDAGCGSGVLTNLAATLNPTAEVYGFDTNEESISFAQEKFHSQPNVIFRRLDLLSARSFEDMEFDFIFAFEVLEHFNEEDALIFLGNLFNMGSRSANYLLTTPDYHSLWVIIEMVMDLFKLTPQMAGHQHLTRFSKGRLESIIQGQGFKIVDLFNFCGISPFLGHISLGLAEMVYSLEKQINYGHLICCHFRKD